MKREKIQKETVLKRILALAMVLCLSVAFIGCSSEPAEETPQNPEEDASVEASGDELTEGEAEAEEPVEEEEPADAEEPEEEEAEAPAPQQKPDPVKNPPQGDGSDYGVPIVSTLTKDDGNLLVLVNKEYTVSRDYYPTDMVDIDGSLSTNQNLKVKREAYDAYLEMLADAKAEGLKFCICSAYRGFSVQESLYYNSLSSNGKAYTDKMFAYPGRSEHHTGYAIDITSASMNWGLSQNYADYPDGAWIAEHCHEYGFIIRYPKGKENITGYMYEPWHIRYVGVDIATEITEAGITLEEYLGVA